VEEGFRQFDEIKALDIPFARKVDHMTRWKVEFGAPINAEFIREMVSIDNIIAGVKARFLENLVDARNNGEIRDDNDPEFLWIVTAKQALETICIKYLLRMVVHGQRDVCRGLLGLSPHRIPIVGKPGSIGMLTTPGELEFFQQFVPETFVNETCARIVIRGDKYRPIKCAADVRCPVLMQVCEKDEIIPVSSARETEKLLGAYADARYYPIGHFDIYKGEHFERAVKEQLGFLQKHLFGAES
jgi:hypothetical protein